MEYLPVSLRLRDEPVVLVGAGAVATRKASLLLRAGANLTVVAPDIAPELEALLAAQGGIWQPSTYRESDLHGQKLAVAATPDRTTNEQVYRDARALNIPVNVVDAPQFCTFIFPSIVDRSPLTIAISSGGRSPVLARFLRRRIESALPAAYGRLADWAGRMRQRVKQHVPADTPRRLLWESVVEGAIAEQVLAGNEQRAEEMLEARLQEAGGAARGEVYLVGAGPGDPDLLTFKALRLLQSADTVLYDRLVSPGIVEMARRDADRIYVGKRRGDQSLPHQDIIRLLVDRALLGQRVLRL